MLGPTVETPEEAVQRRADVRAQALEGGPDAVARLRELVELDADERDEDERCRWAEVESLVRVHEAMARMREHTTAGELIEAAPRELCAAVGFSRAMISRVRGSSWDPAFLHIEESVDPEAEQFRAYISSVQIPLDHMLLETNMARRRMPTLVSDPESDPHTFGDIVAVSRSTSYVAAPIAPTRRVIGFFHADRFGQTDPCDEQDRDVLWAFAEHFGLLFERLVLLERLEEQRGRLRTALAEASDQIDELCSAELVLVRRGPLAVPPLASSRGRGGSRLESLLTPRELEVLDLLVTGMTNAALARRLVVSEGTIKSHLKRILRKLHVTNRAEAVAKYLHLRRLDEGG